MAGGFGGGFGTPAGFDASPPGGGFGLYDQQTHSGFGGGIGGGGGFGAPVRPPRVGVSLIPPPPGALPPPPPPEYVDPRLAAAYGAGSAPSHVPPQHKPLPTPPVPTPGKPERGPTTPVSASMPAPPAAHQPRDPRSEIRSKLETFYSAVQPDKVAQIEQILNLYFEAGVEDRIFADLAEKYSKPPMSETHPEAAKLIEKLVADMHAAAE